LIFWKEAWLKRVRTTLRERLALGMGRKQETGRQEASNRDVTPCTSSKLAEKSRKTTGETESPEDVRYSCQATELLRATTPLSSRAIGPYLHDIRCGNLAVTELLRAIFFLMFHKALRIGGYRALIWTYDSVGKLVGGCPFPFKYGTLSKTPVENLNLQAGELVQVKSQEEILKTVDTRNRNRGLSFDIEMVSYCGGTYRVVQRVEKIIDEKTGKMKRLPDSPIMLDGVVCRAQYTAGRLFCPRSIHPYWRQIWLRRVE